MGTNYYLEPIPASCECCNREFPTRHIGKSSYGWCFTLHVYPDKDINTLEDWKELFYHNQIKDEYGYYVTTEEMLATITEREFNNGIQSHYTEHAEDLHTHPAGFVMMQTITALDISSTAIRSTLKLQNSARYLLPDSIIEFIRTYHLYKK